jgi:toxin ParE1/3/4
MTQFQLSKLAISDLRSIGRYTQKTWGHEQRNRYLGELDAAFKLLVEQPELGYQCDDIRPGYRKFPVGRHLIFYRPTPEGVNIIRILHERMDADTHL